jgi:chorismate mutase
MSSSDPPDLASLRAEIDRIDTNLHDLLMQRAEVVARVAGLGTKGAHPLRPGREARIICRLLARHRPPMSRQTVVRIWREVMSGATAQQAAFRLAVSGGSDIEALAREHFGLLAPLAPQPDELSVIQAITDGRVAAGIVPTPFAGSDWWLDLIHRRERPYVVGLLPFWRPRPLGGAAGTALVLSAAHPDPSDEDISLVAIRDLTGEDTQLIASTRGWALCWKPGALQDDALAGSDGAVSLGWAAVPLKE